MAHPPAPWPRCKRCRVEVAPDVLARYNGHCWWCSTLPPPTPVPSNASAPPIPPAQGPAVWGDALPADYLPPGAR